MWYIFFSKFLILSHSFIHSFNWCLNFIFKSIEEFFFNFQRKYIEKTIDDHMVRRWFILWFLSLCIYWRSFMFFDENKIDIEKKFLNIYECELFQRNKWIMVVIRIVIEKNHIIIYYSVKEDDLQPLIQCWLP